MGLKAWFDLKAKFQTFSVQLGMRAEEEGAIMHDGVLNAGHDGTVFSGGESGTTVFDFDTADEEDNYTVGDYVALYWTSGADVVLDGVITNVDTVNHRVTFTDQGSGTPVDTTVCRIVKHTLFASEFIANNIAAIAALIPSGLTYGYFSFWDGGAGAGVAIYIGLTAGTPSCWIENIGVTNPYAGLTPDEASFVAYDAVGTEKCKFALIHDNVD